MEPGWWSTPAVAEVQHGGSSEKLVLALAAGGDSFQLGLAGDGSSELEQELPRELEQGGSVAG